MVEKEDTVIMYVREVPREVKERFKIACMKYAMENSETSAMNHRLVELMREFNNQWYGKQ